MLTTSELVENYIVKYHDKIQKVCEPLLSLPGITDFFRCTINRQGQATFLATNTSWNEEAWSQKYHFFHPFICSPDLIQEGLHITSKDNYPNMLQQVRENYGCNHEIFYVKKYSDVAEILCFPCQLKNTSYANVYVNELPLLLSFNSYFKKEMKEIITEMQQNPADLNKEMGKFFYNGEKCLRNSLDFDVKKRMLAKMQEFPSKLEKIELTSREKSLLSQCKRGRSAREIALFFNLSRRTIESYLENIKRKLNCSNKSELIEQIEKLELLGYKF